MKIKILSKNKFLLMHYELGSSIHYTAVKIDGFSITGIEDIKRDCLYIATRDAEKYFNRKEKNEKED